MIYFSEYGNKENPTILILHGAGATDSFTCQYCLKEKYHLIIPHLFGSGKEMDKVYEPESQISAIVELIKHLNKEKIIIMGHSLGAELAVALVSRYPEFFEKGIFLSAWLFQSEKSLQFYTNISKKIYFVYKFPWLIKLQNKYWRYTKEQSDFMVEYSGKIKKEQVSAWFTNRIKLNELPEYENVQIPMLAVCGSKETKEIKHSLLELGKRNTYCKTMVLKGRTHAFPIRKSKQTNEIILDFLMK